MSHKKLQMKITLDCVYMQLFIQQGSRAGFQNRALIVLQIYNQ